MSATVRSWRIGGRKRPLPWTYRLVERGAWGEVSEVFQAPDDTFALTRAREVAKGDVVELWRDAVLIDRWEGDPPGRGPADLRLRN